jgi:hypothetical protein
MNGCHKDCPLEAEQADHRSVGVVDDDELIIRAAYDPAHFKKGKLQNSIIRAKDLLAGTLSVWRVSEKSGIDVAAAVKICKENRPLGQSLAEVRGVAVGELRAARRPEINGRLFCVVDETDTDEGEGSHPAHAHVRVCQQLMEVIHDGQDEVFIMVKSHLTFLVKRPAAQLYPVS